jgi:hypothetical protein
MDILNTCWLHLRIIIPLSLIQTLSSLLQRVRNHLILLYLHRLSPSNGFLSFPVYVYYGRGLSRNPFLLTSNGRLKTLDSSTKWVIHQPTHFNPPHTLCNLSTDSIKTPLTTVPLLLHGVWSALLTSYGRCCSATDILVCYTIKMGSRVWGLNEILLVQEWVEWWCFLNILTSFRIL